MQRSLRRLRLATACLVVACTPGDTGPSNVLVVSVVEVSPPSATVVLGSTLQLAAVGRTSSGVTVTGRAITWSTTNPAVASVSATGLVTGVAIGGPVTIRATVDGVAGSASIAVTPVPVAQVAVEPSQVTLLVGQAQQFQATAFGSGGQPLTGRTVTWTSDDPTIATVGTTGTVIAVAPGGPVTIRATIEGQVGTAQVRVSPRPASRLGFVAHPPPGTADQPLSPAIRVAVQDDIGQTVPAANATITVALSSAPTGAVLSGTTTRATVSGIATFDDLRVDRAGNYVLSAGATGLSPALSNGFTVGSGSATRLGLTTQPAATSVSGAVLTRQPVVQLQDAAGNPVAQAGVVVTASVASGPGTLGGTQTVATDGTGAAGFGNLALSGPAGAYTLRFTAPGLTEVVSATVTLTAGNATRLVLVTQPSVNAQSSIPLVQQPALQLRDANGNDVPQGGVLVAAAVSAGGTITGADAVITNAAGRAVFPNLAISGPAGTYTLTFTSGALPPVVSNQITLGAGPTAKLSITTQPSAAAQSGVPFPQQPAIQLRDAANNAVTQAGIVVTASVASGAATLGGTLSATTDATGLATFTDLRLTGTAGPHTLQFQSGSLTGVTSATITLGAGAAAALRITTQPSTSAQSGVPFATQPVVQVVDASGNPVAQAGTQVTASLASGSGTLGGTLTVTTGAGGAASYTDLSITGPAGTYTIQFAASGLGTVVSGIVGLGAGVATQVVVVTQPSASVQSGVAFPQQPVVELRDASNNPVFTAGVTVTASIASGGGTLGGTLTATTNASGRATFTDLAISGTVGSRTLQFAAGGLAPATSASVTVTAGPAARLGMATQPSASVQNTQPLPQQPVVRLEDAAGNPVAQSGITVTASIASGGGTLGGTLTAVTNGSGTATFTNLAITGTVGPRTLGFGASGLAGVTSGTVTVTAGPAAALSITTQPSASAQSGVAFAQQPVIQLRDVSGNAVAQAGVGITAAIAGGGGTLGGTATVATDGAGQAAFAGLSITGAAGPRTLGFSATGLTGITSATITIAAGTATQLTVTTQPSGSAPSGVAFAQQPTVQLRDGSGNAVAQAGVNVTAVIASGGGTLGGTATVATDASGLATFTNLSISGIVGGRTLRFDAAGLTSATSNTVTITPGPAARLAVTVQPSPTAQSGVAFAQQPVVQIQDAAGNNVSQSGTPVTASIATGSGATLDGNTVAVTDGTGQASFTNLRLTGSSGNFTLGFAATGLTGTSSNTIALGAGAPSTLSLTTQPSASVQNGVPFPQQPVIQLRDASNNPVAQPGVLVTATIQTGGGTLGGTVTVATDASGAATFTNLQITGVVGARTLIFAASGYVSVSSNSISVTAGAAAALTLTTQPSATAASGAVFAQQPVVQLVDQSGNTVAQSGVMVTAALASGGGTLGGTTSATTGAGGAASFTNLGITGTAGPRTLSFSATGLTGVTSSTINLIAGAATALTITTPPSAAAQVGVAFAQQPVIQLRDGGGNPVTQAGVTVTASIATGGGTLGGATAVATDASGVATFANLNIVGTVGDRTLRFDATGLTGVVSGTISVSTGPASRLLITTQPSPAAQSGSAFPQQPVVQVADAGGNPVSQAGVTVTAAIATGSGATLGGTTAVATGGGGAAAFTDLVLTGTAGDFTLGFSASGLTGVTSGTIALGAGAAASLVMWTEPSANAQSGVVLAQQPVVRVLDASGNNVADVTVTASVTGGGATLGGTAAVVSANNGRASFTNLALNGALGNYTLTFTAPVSLTVQSASIALATGPASSIAAHPPAPPASAPVGSTVSPSPTVRVTDSGGNPVAGVNVSFVVTAGGGSVGSGSVATAADGTASTSWTLGPAAGGNTLSASAAGLSGSPVGFSVTGVALLSITTASPLPAGTQGAAYSTTFAASGGTPAYTWSVEAGSSLPAGLGLNGATGELSGTPSASGTFNFTIRVTDAAAPTPQFTTKAFALTINPPALSITTASPLSAGTQGAAYSTTFGASGGTPPYGGWTVTSGTLPAGLSLNAGTGELSGTPTENGNFNFTVRVSDAAAPTPQQASKAFALTINSP